MDVLNKYSYESGLQPCDKCPNVTKLPVVIEYRVNLLPQVTQQQKMLGLGEPRHVARSTKS
jgi:hypothetical protein